LPGLKPFISARAGYLNAHPDINKQVPSITGLTHSPSRPEPGEKVWINAKVTASSGVSEVVLAHGTAGIFTTLTMYDDGNHHDGIKGDGVYGEAIPGVGFNTTVHIYVYGRARGGGIAFSPPRAEQVTSLYTATVGPVRIHEFLARNNTGIKDEKGEYEDWIEVLNAGQSVVDLSGCYLTDDMQNPTLWKIPAGNALQPGQTLLFWADNELNEGPLHTSFKLSADGETLALFDKDGKTLLDSITFGTQLADVSTGRMAGFDGTWVTFPDPTPRSPNRPAQSCGHLRYDGRNPASTPLGLTASGVPGIGNLVFYHIDSAPASTPGYLGLSAAPLHADLGVAGTLLIHPLYLALFPVATNTVGKASLPLSIPKETALKGIPFYLQGFVHDGTTGGLTSSVLSQVCP